MTTPNPKQDAHCLLAQQELQELAARLRAEGMDNRIIFAGITAGLANEVMGAFGASEVSTWFLRAAGMTVELGQSTNR